ncbi:unnamed protein product [Larinioides sclopetarius]|uniref:Uncharacterized protein n=1 Tax=Larinioides sclopetarius TaxID=280406 RepID=A0AAV2AAR0_9ARAC
MHKNFNNVSVASVGLKCAGEKTWNECRLMGLWGLKPLLLFFLHTESLFSEDCCIRFNCLGLVLMLANGYYIILMLHFWLALSSSSENEIQKKIGKVKPNKET